MVDLSDKPGRVRAGLNDADTVTANEGKVVLLVGNAARRPCIQSAAVLHTIDTSTAPRSGMHTAAHALQLKAIPEPALRQMDAAKQRANEEARRKDTGKGTEAQRTDMRADMLWTRERVTVQLLLHNPYMGDGPDIADRSTEHTENMAIKWAQHGKLRCTMCSMSRATRCSHQSNSLSSGHS